MYRKLSVIEPLERRTLMSVTPITLATFNGAFGSGVAVDSSGDVFGTTASTDTTAGNVFEIPAGTTTVKTLASYGDSIYPGGPQTGENDILVDAAGDVFGTAKREIQSGDSQF